MKKQRIIGLTVILSLTVLMVSFNFLNDTSTLSEINIEEKDLAKIDDNLIKEFKLKTVKLELSILGNEYLNVVINPINSVKSEELKRNIELYLKHNYSFLKNYKINVSYTQNLS